MTPPLPPELQEILSRTDLLQHAYVVGGCVRDWLLGLPNKDYDIEVYGISYANLVSVLSQWGRADVVGRSFGVLKLATPAGQTYDFSIPRRDSKVASGHKGFEVLFDPGLSLREAAARRDFTINALMYDPHKREVLDFFGGKEDLERRILRHTSEAFIEDPLRVLRGMQFAGRFNLRAAPETLRLCASIRAAYHELAIERVREEWFKWAAKSTRPSAGLKFLADTRWIDHFPEISALPGVPQDPEWHPEGDVFVHTCHCCDAMSQLPGWQAADEAGRVVYMLAILAHDFAKPQTTSQAMKDGRLRIVSPGHEEAGGPLTESFLNRINAPHAIMERVVPLVTNHLAHMQQLSERSVRRLAKRLEPENIHGLLQVMMADSLGRPPQPAVIPESILELQRRAEALQVQLKAPQPMLMGRHLLELGLTPGPEIGRILEAAFSAQLEGRFAHVAEALRWLGSQEQFKLPQELLDKIQKTVNDGIPSKPKHNVD